jgi:hypothetical protein
MSEVLWAGCARPRGDVNQGYTARDAARIFNLQTIAESLATESKVESLVMCTAQAELGRSSTQIALKSADAQAQE